MVTWTSAWALECVKPGSYMGSLTCEAGLGLYILELLIHMYRKCGGWQLYSATNAHCSHIGYSARLTYSPPLPVRALSKQGARQFCVREVWVEIGGNSKQSSIELSDYFKLLRSYGEYRVRSRGCEEYQASATSGG
jgi:hypothetical protein